jgi:GR25 family glycosyltransferase involved in LPS biosynthesis
VTNKAQTPVFLINLEVDVQRRESMLKQFTNLDDFSLRIVKAINGASLAAPICNALACNKNWASRKGTIACFLSHVRAWEEAAAVEQPFVVVLEDDVSVRGLTELGELEIPHDADIIFLNDRMSANKGPSIKLETQPVWQALKNLDKMRAGGPGGDGYLLTPGGARKMLAACEQDLFFGHVDGRLLRYATSMDDLSMLDDGSWIGEVIRKHHHPTLRPAMGILKGFCLSRPLVSHLGVPSTREAYDRADVP